MVKPWEIDRTTGSNGPTVQRNDAPSTSTAGRRFVNPPATLTQAQSDAFIDSRTSGDSSPVASSTLGAGTNAILDAGADRYVNGNGVNYFGQDDFWAGRSGQQNLFGNITRYNNDPAFNPFVGLPPGAPPGGSPTGGGGGGGYGSSYDKKKWDQFMAYQLAAIAGIKPHGIGPRPEDKLSGLVNKTVDESKASGQAAYDGVEDLVANAYRDRTVAAAPTFDPRIEALLEAQGMGTDYARASQMQGQGGLDELAGLFAEHNDVMAANTDDANMRRNADVDEQAAQNGIDMEALRSSLLMQAGAQYDQRVGAYEQQQAAAEAQAAEQRRSLTMNLLSQGLGGGMAMDGIDIAKLLGGY